MVPMAIRGLLWMLSAQPAPAICLLFRQTKTGRHATIYQTSGNPYGHIIMRGAKKPNHHADDIAAACDTLHEFDLPEHLVVDFYYGNCQSQHRRQLEVCEDICQANPHGYRHCWHYGESFLRETTQKIVGSQPLTYGQSITDHVSGLGGYRTPGRVNSPLR